MQQSKKGLKNKQTGFSTLTSLFKYSIQILAEMAFSNVKLKKF